MLPSFSSELRSELDSLHERNRLRSCPSIKRLSPVELIVDGTPLISFCSNDYLGMACHPALFEAAKLAFSNSGFGASASRLVSGTFPEHLSLEESLASLVGTEAALLFPSGYQANLGALTAIAGPDDLIVADRSVHASLIDACRLSRAKLALYPHCDVSQAEKHLCRLGPAARRRILITESLFSMDGDVAPLSDLALLAQCKDSILLVDEAHAIGTLGARGSGLCRHFGVTPDLLIGTLGKTIGASGAFVAGSATLRSFLINHARSFLFTTALPPCVSAGALASVRILTSERGDALRQSLQTAVSALRAQLDLPPDPLGSPILPIVLGQDPIALAASAHLRNSGFFVQAIRPPTVREGTARLRVTLCAHHRPQHISALVAAINRLSSSTRGPARPQRPRPYHATPSSAQGLVILGTDTSVGKTIVASALLRLLSSRGYQPVPFKPVETGVHPSNPTDAIRLSEAAVRQDIPLDVISPIRFSEPLAPLAASQKSGNPLTLDLLHSAFRAAHSYGSPIVIETAGGLLTPYADHLTSLDIASELRLPVLLVARNALGTINHTTLSLREILRRSITFLGLILVQTQPEMTPDQASNPSILARLTGHTALGVFPHLRSPTPSQLAAALQENVNLSPILSLLPLSPYAP